MATLSQDLKKQLDVKKAELKKWQNPKTNRETGNLEIDGKVYTEAQIAQEVSRLTTVVGRLQKSFDERVGVENRLDDNRDKQERVKEEYVTGLEKSRGDYLRWLDIFRTGYEGGYYARPAEYASVSLDEWKQNIVPGLISKYSANVVEMTSFINNFREGKPMFTELKIAPAPVQTVTTITPPTYTTPPTQLGPGAPAPAPAPSTANATQLAQAGIGGAIDYEALIAGQATGTTTTGTTATGMGGGGGGGGGPAPAPAPIVLSAEAQRYLKSLARTAWLDTANTRFGWVAQLYDTDPSIKALMDRAVTQGYTPNRFAAELRNTSWWKNTSASVRSYMGLQATDPAALQEQVNKLKPEIRNQASTLGLSLDEATITKLANDGVKYGWTQTQVANHIGAEAIKEDRLAGGMAGGSQELSNATALQNIRNIANDYMIDVTDQEFNQFTRQILSGKKTEQDFTNLMKSRAKLQYSGLTENIDRGETVRGSTESYRNIAANLLEITPDEVNFSDEKFAPAFNFVDDATKKPRQMNMQEWAQYIRSTPDWQQTENARNTYREAAFTLARSFGMYQ